MTVADELEKIHQLHVRGVITADEFAAQKAKLLANDAAPVAQGSGATDSSKGATAKSLVTASHILGWGGLGLALVTTVVAFSGGLKSLGIGLLIAGFGIVCAIIGGILGQIGRGMQGRAL